MFVISIIEKKTLRLSSLLLRPGPSQSRHVSTCTWDLDRVPHIKMQAV
jgi:hypothetical protein